MSSATRSRTACERATSRRHAPTTRKSVPIAMAVVHKCKVCGLRQQMDPNGVMVYDDYYMYGGGYMMGLEMGMMFGIMGAASTAYADPYYGEYYGGEYGGEYGGFDDGFAADGGDDFDF